MHWAESLKDERIVTLKVTNKIVDLVDKDRSPTKTPRTAWIMQAIIDRLERLGYDLDEGV